MNRSIPLNYKGNILKYNKSWALNIEDGFHDDA